MRKDRARHAGTVRMGLVGLADRIELLRYEADSLGFSGYVHLDADDPYLIALMHDWDARLREAFQQVPRFEWGAIPKSSRFR